MDFFKKKKKMEGKLRMIIFLGCFFIWIVIFVIYEKDF